MDKFLRIFVFVGCCPLLLFYCTTTKNSHKIPTISYSCQLRDRIGDTIILEGIYWTCMEYSSFIVSGSDNCKKEFSIQLNTSKCSIPPDLKPEFNKLTYCGSSIEFTLKGVLTKTPGKSYGHLGSNNCEFNAFEILKFSKTFNASKTDQE